MTFVQYQNCISPHQVPLAHEIAKLIGEKNFHYVYRDQARTSRLALGWKMCEDADWFLHEGSHQTEARELIETVDVVLTGFRDVTLFRKRSKKGLVTFYASERWFKPIYLLRGLIRLPGRIRMFVPSFRRMATDIVELLENDENFYYLPIGVHALSDMQKICKREDKMFLWGYFVTPHDSSESATENLLHNKFLAKDFFARRLPQACDATMLPLRILYVGRLLQLKHVDTIVKAVEQMTRQGINVQLQIVGDGPERARLEKMAIGLPVSFMDPVPIENVRPLMRRNDVLVFSSDGRDGWGAVVNEALEEGLVVLGTKETGASATLLPPERQFHSGDIKALIVLLRKTATGDFSASGIRGWSVHKAAIRLLGLAESCQNRIHL